MLRNICFAIGALLLTTEAAAQTSTRTVQSLITSCVALVPTNSSLVQQLQLPLFARLDESAWYDQPGQRVLRVAAPDSARLRSASQQYGRNSHWSATADTMRLNFSTGFTVVTFAFALTPADTLRGGITVWNDAGPTIYPGGNATLTFVPCAQLVLP